MHKRSVILTDEESARIRAYIGRVGGRVAMRELGIGDEMLRAMRERGHMLQATRDRLIAALDRVEGSARS
jgi:hypothetical protein